MCSPPRVYERERDRDRQTDRQTDRFGVLRPVNRYGYIMARERDDEDDDDDEARLKI